MILSIGEILVDMVGVEGERGLAFSAFAGGAPFNVAVNAKQAGARVAFVGRVGNDPVGRFLIKEAAKARLDRLDIQIDSERNTTLAFVSLTDGERDFAFHRHDTADFNICADEIDLDSYEGLNIVHLGSLMLSEPVGRAVANAVCEKVHKAKRLLSFDLNFRKDIYRDFQDAIAAYKPYVDVADIIKFSEDELRDFTGKNDIIEGIRSIYRDNTLVVVTLGADGSLYYINGKYGTVETSKVKPVDTTGAGDAFFGTLLAGIEGKELNEDNIVAALRAANRSGAETTQFLGAIKL